MAEQVSVRVFEVVGSALCVASDDGQKVHDQVAAALRGNHKVELSFRNIKSLTSAFLNAAIGQLYGEFSEEQIRTGLSVVDATQDDLLLVKRVADRAKEYFRDPARFEVAAAEVLGGDDG